MLCCRGSITPFLLNFYMLTKDQIFKTSANSVPFVPEMRCACANSYFILLLYQNNEQDKIHH